MKIADACKIGIRELKNKTDLPDLEAELLLAKVLNVSRAYLYTWPEKSLTPLQEALFLKLLRRRQLGEPSAYLLGHKEFWSLDLLVSPDVLIPRQETEMLVENVLQKISSKSVRIADLGTGSGAIALALAYEQPAWHVHATDNSEQALAIAQLNLTKLSLKNVTLHLGSWCDALPSFQFDVIVSNPPYIAKNDPALEADVLSFEPVTALISDEDGLKDIRDIIVCSRHFLRKKGMLFLEHGYQQAKKVASIFEQAGYTGIEVIKDLAGLDRVTFASWQGFEIN